jgi:oligosaccharide repeat unit polymerase
MANKNNRVTRKKDHHWLLLIVQGYVLMGLTVVGLVYALIGSSGFVVSPEIAFQILCMFFLGLTIWLFLSWYLITNRLFDPYVLFLLAAVIFNGGQIILEVFGLNSKGFLDNTFATPEALQVVYIVALTLTTMHFGAMLAIVLDRQKSRSEKFLDFLDRTAESSSHARARIKLSRTGKTGFGAKPRRSRTLNSTKFGTRSLRASGFSNTNSGFGNTKSGFNNTKSRRKPQRLVGTATIPPPRASVTISRSRSGNKLSRLLANIFGVGRKPPRLSTIAVHSSQVQIQPFSQSEMFDANAPLSEIKLSVVPLNTIFTVGRTLLFLSVLPVFVTAFGAIQIAKLGGYAATYEQQVTGAAASVAILGDFVFPGAFLTIAGAKNHPKLRIFAVIVILCYTCAKLVIGTRGAAVMPLLAMLWLWDSVVKPLPRTLLIVGAAVMLLIVFPIIGATRNEVAGVDLFSIDFLSKTLMGADNPLVASISEMGFSATTIGWTMDLVPKVRPFALGMSVIVAILTLIPNVFSAGRHPALTMSGYDIPDYWLVREIDPDFAERGGSFGFSFIAEAYLNFGWLGILVLGGLGFFYARFVQWAVRDRDPLKMAIIAIFVSFFLFYPRGSCQMIFRPLIWYSMFPHLLIKWQGQLNPARVKNLLTIINKGKR